MSPAAPRSLALACLVVFGAPSVSHAVGPWDDNAARREEPERLGPARGKESARDVAVRGAFERGLAWLVAGQDRNLDGSMPVGAKDHQRVPIAATALGALALMAGGHAYDRGPYGANVARAIDYLLAHATLDPKHPEHGYIGRADAPQAVRMHSFGFAALALAEAYSTSPHSDRGRAVGRALEASVRLIERTQGREGAWFYEPKRMQQHEGSVTICLVQVLRAARDAGIRVDPGVIARAEEYVQKSQMDDGLFAYQLDDPDAHTSVALTAAAVCTLYSLGEYASATVDRGIGAIWRELALRDEGLGDEVRFPYYERFYLAQAFWQNTEREHFERWSASELPRMISDQLPDGRWREPRHGDGYATAMNCLVLAMSDQLLPIFQR
jgi:hypothetical protein